MPVRQTASRPATSCPRSTPTAGTATSRAWSRATATATGSTGPYEPEAGLRCNPAKLLLDPYAKAVDGEVSWGQPPYSYDRQAPTTCTIDTSDSAASMPKAIVVDPAFDWGADRPPRTLLGRHRHLRDPRQGSDLDTSRTSRTSSVAPTPRWPTRPSSSTSPSWGSRPSS